MIKYTVINSLLQSLRRQIIKLSTSATSVSHGRAEYYVHWSRRTGKRLDSPTNGSLARLAVACCALIWQTTSRNRRTDIPPRIPDKLLYRFPLNAVGIIIKVSSRNKLVQPFWDFQSKLKYCNDSMRLTFCVFSQWRIGLHENYRHVYQRYENIVPYIRKRYIKHA